MATSDIRIGIVGPGAIAGFHAEALESLNCRLNAVAGPIQQDVTDLADKYNVDYRYSSIERLIEERVVDAVIVSAPSQEHFRLSKLALDSGLHVLSEIPIALRVSEAFEIAELADSLSCVAMVAHTLRYYGAYRLLADTLKESGAVPLHVISMSTVLRHENVGWTGRHRDWTDNVLWHHGAHAVDSVLWALGDEDVEVLGACGRDWEVTKAPMDVATALVTNDGRLGSVNLSYHSRMAENYLVVICEDETYRIEDGRLSTSESVLWDVADDQTALRRAIVSQDADFLSAIIDGSEPQYSVRSALSTMRVLDQIERQTRDH